MAGKMQGQPILLTFTRKKKRSSFLPFLAYSGIFGGLFLLLTSFSLTMFLLVRTQHTVIALGINKETRIAATNIKKDADYTVEPDENNNIIFEKKSSGSRTALIRVKPKVPGNYLYFGPLCVTQRAKGDTFVQVAMDGETAQLLNLDTNEYYVDCDKENDTDMFSFRLLNADGVGGGTGGPEIYPYALNNPGAIAGPAPAISSGSQAQINYTFAPSNSFSPTIVNNPEPTPAPTPTPQPSSIIPIPPSLPLPTLLP